MTASNSNVFQLKSIFTFLVILALTITSKTSARRILDEEPIVATDESTPTSGVSAVAGAGPATHADHPATDDHIFSFFMHDILGGSNPSAIAVTITKRTSPIR